MIELPRDLAAANAEVARYIEAWMKPKPEPEPKPAGELIHADALVHDACG